MIMQYAYKLKKYASLSMSIRVIRYQQGAVATSRISQEKILLYLLKPDSEENLKRQAYFSKGNKS